MTIVELFHILATPATLARFVQLGESSLIGLPVTIGLMPRRNAGSMYRFRRDVGLQHFASSANSFLNKKVSPGIQHARTSIALFFSLKIGLMHAICIRNRRFQPSDNRT